MHWMYIHTTVIHNKLTYSFWTLHTDSEQLDRSHSQISCASVWKVSCNSVQHCPQQYTILQHKINRWIKRFIMKYQLHAMTSTPIFARNQ